MCGDRLLYRTVCRKFQLVYTNLPVISCCAAHFYTVRVSKPVVNDIPVVSARYLYHRIMPRAVNTFRLIFLYDYIISRYRKRACGRCGCAIPYTVVGTTGIIFAPHKIISAFPIENICALAEGFIYFNNLGSVRFKRYHVFIQFSYRHIAIAPVQVAFAGLRIRKYIRIDLLPAFYSGRLLCHQRFT